MCNLYSLTKSQDEIRDAFWIDADRTGNLPPLPAIFPNTAAPIVHMEEGQRVLSMHRWGMPSPAFALEGKRVDPGVTTVRNTGSPHWGRWLGPEHRCLVPLSSVSEFNGPRMIHRKWDRIARNDVGPGDAVTFAEGDEHKPLPDYNATDIDERWL